MRGNLKQGLARIHRLAGFDVDHRNLAIALLHRGDLAAAASARERADEIDRTAVGSAPPGSR